MINNYKTMIIIKGEPSDTVVDCHYDKATKRRIVAFPNGKSFPYAYNSVEWLENPASINIDEFLIENNKGDVFDNINKVLVFSGQSGKYYRVFFANGTIKSYKETDLKIKKKVLSFEKAKTLFDYYKQVSEVTGLKDEDGKNTLTAKYEKCSSAVDNTVLDKYIYPSELTQKSVSRETVLFPFGCNSSQIKAVRNALDNKISIIEGPPGTGKTQTILNIIANLVARENTVAVVSNNNDATKNVYEKLQKYGFNYIVAELGSNDNKKDFIDNKQTKYPDFLRDILENSTYQDISYKVTTLENDLEKMLNNKNKLATLKQELSSLLVEKQYFDEYFDSTFEDKEVFKNTSKLTSRVVLELWHDCQFVAEQRKRIGFFKKLSYYFIYGVDSFSLFKDDVIEIIPQFKKLFYSLKLSEMQEEIAYFEDSLKNFDKTIDELSKKSMTLFKHRLAKKYRNQERNIFTLDDLWKNSIDVIAEYPVVLSSTYSAFSSLNGVVYDYVIVDEASQVDLATGVLSMACAVNIVVVGDLKQLPNVIAPKTESKLTAISDYSNIPYQYRQEEQSLLSSICQVFDSAPRILLREHYRCHPKIIEFCNQKFYNGQLIVMTEDKNESDVLKVHITSTGDHARGHYNQRQIDEIQRNIIPELNSDDLGIISPYRAQTSALFEQIQNNIPISTVHKFQGRENNDIIISTVDNEITDFTDNPNMLNVAVSRAKNRLRLVISDNKKNENTNIGDLVKYIQFNNFEVVKSDIFSVFDMLYKSYAETRKEYLSKHKKVSEYDSENLMYLVIEEVLSADEFSKLDVVTHQPLNTIIRDLHKLNDVETKYVMNSWTHVDFMIFNSIDKSPVLAVEVDGYEFHKTGTDQHKRDVMKDDILNKYGIPIIRFNTTGSGEKERLENKLKQVLK